MRDSKQSFFQSSSSWVRDTAATIKIPDVEFPSLGKQKIKADLKKANIPALADSPEPWKVFYVRCLISLALRTEDRLSARETAELRIIMSNLKLGPQQRVELCSKFNQEPEDFDPDEVADISEDQSDWAQTFKFCLIKDLLRIYSLDSKDDPLTSEDIISASIALGLSLDHVKAAKALIKTEIDLHEGKEPSLVFEETVKKSLSTVTGAGLPVAALFYSGSVTGLSAAGIVSGLASMGSIATVLGLSPMVGGVAAIGVIGVGSAVGIHAAADAVVGKRQRAAIRENMRKQAHEAVQISLHDLNEDVNFLSSELNAGAAEQELLLQRVEALRLRDTLVASISALDTR